jgi:hypothetical protein
MSQAHVCTKYVPQKLKDDRAEPKMDPLYTDLPPKPKIRAEVEPETSNMTLYGVSRDPGNPKAGWPHTYAAKDWVSHAKTDFPRVTNTDRITKDLQVERANFMRSSFVQIGDPSQAPHRVTQHVSYQPYERDWYTNHVCFPIGGKYNKVRSDVILTGKSADERQYETMTARQFHPYPNAAGARGSFQQHNKEDMMKSHFSVGVDPVDYRPVASTPLATAPPLIKNRPPSAVAKEKNPHYVPDASAARPRRLTAQEVSASKLESSLPLQQSNVEMLRVTTTGSSLPVFHAKKQQKVTTTRTTISSVSLGCGEGNRVPATKAQYRGIYFKPAADP